jgi:hypothetical protein
MVAQVVGVRTFEDKRNPFSIGKLPELFKQLLLAVIAAVRGVLDILFRGEFFRAENPVGHAERPRKILRRLQFASRIGL